MLGERDRAFALLFAVADAPLVLFLAVPTTGVTALLGGLVLLVSWATVGAYVLAAVRAPTLETRGWTDGPWALATLGPPAAIAAWAWLAPGTIPGLGWSVVGSLVTLPMLGVFWWVYAAGGGVFVGPAMLRYGLGSLALEDRVAMVGILGMPGTALAVSVLAGPSVPDVVYPMALIGVPLVAYLATMFVMDRRRSTGWDRLARRLGWDEPGDGNLPPMEGVFRSRVARVGAVRDRMRWFTFWTTDARVTLEGPAADLDLRLEPEGRLARLQRALGARDAEVGRGRFDDRFLVDTSQPEAAQALFRALGDRLLDARSWTRAVTVTDGDLVVAMPGVVTDPPRVREALDLAAGVAAALEDHARDAEER